MALYESVVKWFDAKKGYGFLVHHDGGSDIFIHYSQIQTEDRFKTLRTGQRVRYDVEDGPKGLHAISVEVLASEDDYDGGDNHSDYAEEAPVDESVSEDDASLER